MFDISLFCSLADISNRTVTIERCDVEINFDLTECNTSVLSTVCSTDDLAWVQCSRGSKFHINCACQYM